MPTLYALNLTADLSGNSTGFFNPYSSAGGQNRCWMCSPDAGLTWSACNNGNNNSDTWGPTLNFSRSGTGPTPTDQVQFAVFSVNLPAGVSIGSAYIFVTFGRMGRTNASNSVASPFQNLNGNAVCIQGDSSTAHYDVNNGAYYIGRFAISINQGAVRGNGNLNFEFSLVAKFTLSNGQVYEYGYDPELDVDVGP